MFGQHLIIDDEINSGYNPVSLQAAGWGITRITSGYENTVGSFGITPRGVKYDEFIYISKVPVNFYASSFSSCLLKTDGTLWLGGSMVFSTSDDLGNFRGSENQFYKQLGVDTDWDSVCLGDNHVLLTKTDGTLWSSGENSEGALGVGDELGRLGEVQIGTDTDWVEISASGLQGFNGDSSFAIKSGGTLWSCGANASGQLGLGDNTNRNTFTQVGVGVIWDKISSAHETAFALKTDGTLWSCGDNTYGNLGLLDNSDRNSFTQVGIDTDWADVKCSPQHTLALKTDGTLWSCGRNNAGQLGLGDNVDTNDFNKIGVDTTWTKIGVGGGSSAAVKGGELYTTGDNTSGQLGLGDNTNRNVFVQVGASVAWVDVVVGGNFMIAQLGLP